MVLKKQFISDVEEVIVSSFKKDSIIKELSESIAKCLYNKFEKEFSELRQEITTVKQEFKEFKKQASENEKKYKQKLNMLDQQTRKKNIVVFGFKESEGENLKNEIIEFFNNSSLKTELTTQTINRCHRLGNQIDYNQPRPIIVKFMNYESKINIIRMKKKLKGTGITIKEDLTLENLRIYNQAAQKYGYKNTWTKNGTVFARTKEGHDIIYREKQRIISTDDEENSGEDD